MEIGKKRMTRGEKRMSLISREAALDAIDKNRQDLLSLGMDGAEHILVHYGRRVIEELPSAERVGKWIRHPEVKNIYGGVYIECSECREKYVVQYVEDEKFCRNCGARMEGEEG